MRRTLILALVPLALALVLFTPGMLRRQATAQAAGPTVTQFPGATVDYTGPRYETHSVVTFCPAGSFAISGGWSVVSGLRAGPADMTVLDSYPSQLPGGGGAGAWTLTIRKLGIGPLTVTPYVTCLSGVAQAPE